MIFVVGARGRLGRAICSGHAASNPVQLERGIYENWWQPQSRDEISRYFEPWQKTGSTIFVASGVLDPRLPGEVHEKVNYQLPRNIIEGVAGSGFQVMTFGTVMERLLTSQNSYIRSKALLGNYVAGLPANVSRTLHLQLHTLYGTGNPSPYMFLGQVLAALANASEFAMTAGSQLREYHHVDDDVRAVQLLLQSKLTGVTDLSHGKPVTLAALATHIFRGFDAARLLKIGTLPEPKEENYETKFHRSAALNEMEFRETLPAVTQYLKTCLTEMDG
jgi:hypothetical protein